MLCMISVGCLMRSQTRTHDRRQLEQFDWRAERHQPAGRMNQHRALIVDIGAALVVQINGLRVIEPSTLMALTSSGLLARQKKRGRQHHQPGNRFRLILGEARGEHRAA